MASVETKRIQVERSKISLTHLWQERLEDKTTLKTQKGYGYLIIARMLCKYTRSLLFFMKLNEHQSVTVVRREYLLLLSFIINMICLST